MVAGEWDVLAAVGSVAMRMHRGNHCSRGNYFIMDRWGGRATRRETLTRRVGRSAGASACALVASAPFQFRRRRSSEP